MFRITPAAAREVLAAAERSNASGAPLRVAAREREDGSIEFGMGFDAERVDDEVSEVEGLQVLVGGRSRALLAAVEMDYVEIEPGRFDFVFATPGTEADAADGSTAQAAPAAPVAAAPGGCGSGGCSRCGG
jgi:iron-sulfur cluster assembly protein